MAVTTVTSDIVSKTLLAVNAARTHGAILNNSASDLFVRLGSPASSTNFTIKLIPGGYWEVPRYLGIVTGIWVTASGDAQVTELP